MTASIFIKSYPDDFKWLGYCLKSLQKYARGFKEIVIQVPPGSNLKLTAERVIEIPETQPGYLYQQVAKLNADLRCPGADYILHIDSDTVLTKETTPEHFISPDGKPIWWIKPYSHWDEEEKRVWLHVMVKFMQEMPPYEFMRRNLNFIPRWAYGEFRRFIESFHKLTMEAYVMNQPGHAFSEYNCLGHYLWKFHREKIHWHDTVLHGVPESHEFQSWSYAGITPEIRAKLEEITA